MCLCCETKAKTIRRNILPGYNLLKGMVGHPEWPIGYYALQRWDDPDFIFKEKPSIDPSKNWTTEKSLKNEKLYAAYLIWAKETEAMEDCFKCSPELGYELYKACLKAGWHPKRDGFRLSFWVRNYMGKKMKKV